MAAIADCDKAIKNMGINNEADEMQQLLKFKEKSIRNNEAVSKSVKLAPHTNADQHDGRTHPLPRVHTIQPLQNEDRLATRNMVKDNPLILRLSYTAVTRSDLR